MHALYRAAPSSNCFCRNLAYSSSDIAGADIGTWCMAGGIDAGYAACAGGGPLMLVLATAASMAATAAKSSAERPDAEAAGAGTEAGAVTGAGVGTGAAFFAGGAKSKITPAAGAAYFFTVARNAGSGNSTDAKLLSKYISLLSASAVSWAALTMPRNAPRGGRHGA